MSVTYEPSFRRLNKRSPRRVDPAGGEPQGEVAWCDGCHAFVILPCVACRARLALERGEPRPLLHSPEDWENFHVTATPIGLCLKAEDQANYRDFWRRFPSGLQAIPAAPEDP